MVGVSIVCMSYLGFWINPAAVPARVGLAIVSVLVVAGNLSSAMRIIPPSTKVKPFIEALH